MDDLKRKRSSSDTATIVPELDIKTKEKVQKLFEKKYHYKLSDSNDDRGNNDNKDFFKWFRAEIDTSMKELDTVKNSLNDKNIISWHQHTGFMNMAGSVVKEVWETIHPELCTQAWCKFYELLSSYPLVPFQSEEFSSLHLCEAPGAFVTSLNHFLRTNGYTGNWQWLGTTLNPYYEGNCTSCMIQDDRFIIHTRDNWDFGQDASGDIMKWENVVSLRTKCQTMAPVCLVTADGSIDCVDMPGEQERVVSRLHGCEALTALLVLGVGGNLVLKRFTMFELESFYLMYLLCTAFQEVHVCKPATSKSGNSEVYVICLSYKGIPQSLQMFAKKYFEDPSTSFNDHYKPQDIPRAFALEHLKCCRLFADLQTQTIQYNLDHYENLSSFETASISSIKDYCADLYIQQYRVRPISWADRIVNCRPHRIHPKNKASRHPPMLNKKMMHAAGTFSDRQRYKSLSLKQRLHLMSEYHLNSSNLTMCKLSWHICPSFAPSEWHCELGSPVTQIKSSSFCSNHLLQQVQEMLEENEEMDHEYLSQVCQNSMLDTVRDLVLHKEEAIFKGEHFDVLSAVDGGKGMETYDIRTTDEKSPVALRQAENSGAQQHAYCLDLFKGCRRFNLDLEIQFLEKMLSLLPVLLKRMKKRDALIIRMTTMLTRKTASVLYMLSHCFQKIVFFRPPNTDLFSHYVVCDVFISVPDWVREQLACCLASLRCDLTNCEMEHCLEQKKGIKAMKRDFEQEIKHSEKSFVNGEVTETKYSCIDVKDIVTTNNFYVEKQHNFQTKEDGFSLEQNVVKSMRSKSTVLLELVPICVLLTDEDFKASLTRANEFYLQSIFNFILQKEKDISVVD